MEIHQSGDDAAETGGEQDLSKLLDTIRKGDKSTGERFSFGPRKSDLARRPKNEDEEERFQELRRKSQQEDKSVLLSFFNDVGKGGNK